MCEKLEPAVSIASARVDCPITMRERPRTRRVVWMGGGRREGARKYEMRGSKKKAECAIEYAEPLAESRKEPVVAALLFA
jgi:hypothetical protein